MQYCTVQELLTLREGESLNFITLQANMVDNVPVITSHIRWDLVEHIPLYIGEILSTTKRLFMCIHSYLPDMAYPNLSMTKDYPPFIEFKIEPTDTRLAVNAYTPYKLLFEDSQSIWATLKPLTDQMSDRINDIFNYLIQEDEEMTHPPKHTSMTEDEFWEIINFSLGVPEVLRDILEPLDFDQLYDFITWYTYFYVKAKRNNLWLAYQMIGGTSMGTFGAFIDWLISQGNEIYTRVINTPDSLGTMDLTQEMSNTPFGNVMIKVYCSKHGDISRKHLEEEYCMKPIDKGNATNEKVLSRLFPLITAKLNQNQNEQEDL